MIDVASLREALIDYFGTAKEVNPAATIDLIQVQNADIYGLIEIAEMVGFNLEEYAVVYDDED